LSTTAWTSTLTGGASGVVLPLLEPPPEPVSEACTGIE
jgi:hypothetical protein